MSTRRLALALAFASFAPFVPRDAAAASDLPTLADEVLGKHIAPLIHDEAYVGVAVGVVVGEEKLVRGLGRVSLDSDASPDGDTVYEIGSVTKVFTGILLAQMDAEGSLSANEAIDELMPEGATPPARDAGPIRLVELATHSSGMPRMPSNFAPADPANPYADYGEDRFAEWLGGLKIAPEAVGKYEYSNAGVGLLGLILARSADLDYETLVVERICDPLGMNDTRVVFSDAMRARLAPPYSAYGKPAANWDIPTFAGAGGLRSTANDMLKFVEANLAIEDTPVHAAMRDSRSERFRSDPGTALGLGWHLKTVEGLDEPLVWHNGQTGGYHSFLGIVPGKGVGAVFLTNTAGYSIDGAAIGAIVDLCAGR